MKNQKGVTLISLIVTIILIMILTSIGIYTSFDTYETMRSRAFISKMITVQEAVDKLCDRYVVSDIMKMGTNYDTAPTEDKNLLNEIITNCDRLNSWNSDIDNIPQNYIYLDINNINKVLGIKDFDTAIWVNPTSRNIIATDGVEYEGIRYYRQYDLSGGQTLPKVNVNTNFNLQYSVKTYDNKAEIILKKDGQETIFEQVKYYKKSNTQYGQAKLLNNVSKIELTEGGVYKVEATDFSGNTQSQEDIIVTIVNKPLLVDGMTPIKFEQSTTSPVSYIKTTNDDKDWYNYGENDQRWANAILKDGSVFVWIPRFAYEIDSTNQKINIQFLKEVSQTSTEGNNIKSTYIVAPAFQDGTHNEFANGEWDTEITGFWVAKYEAVNKNSNLYIGVTENTTSYWGDKLFRDYIVLCRKMEAENKNIYFKDSVTAATGEYNYGYYTVDNNNIDTHLMKNSEWGAIAYLTYSKGTVPSIKTNVYVNQELTKSHSSTNNVTGIYGLTGGLRDAVAAVTVNEDIEYKNVKLFTPKNESTKYITLYNNNINDTNGEFTMDDYDNYVKIYGDGIKGFYEKYGLLDGYKLSYNRAHFITRGGIYSSKNCTIFEYEFAHFSLNKFNRNGDENGSFAFRPTLIVEY